MRLMFTTALASAALFAGPALAAGDKMQSTTGMTQPESSAAQLPSGAADGDMLRQDFEGAGFSDWQAARDLHIFRMQSGDGQPVWLVLMPQNRQLGEASPGLDQDDLPDADTSEQAAAGEMPQRGEQADVSETFEDEAGGQDDLAEGPDVGEPGQDDLAEGPDVGGPGEQDDLAEGQDIGEDIGQPDVAESPDMPEERPDVAEGPEAGQPGIAGETEPEGFAAQIPGELRSDLEGAGFQQIESIDDAEIFQARTEDGRTAFVIVGDLGAAGFDQQPQQGQPGQPGQTAPGAAPGQPEPAPGTAPGTQPQPGQQQ